MILKFSDFVLFCFGIAKPSSSEKVSLLELLVKEVQVAL